jgi:hypothetical protein
MRRKLRSGEPEPEPEENASSVVLIQEKLPPLRISRSPFTATLGMRQLTHARTHTTHSYFSSF